MFSRFNAEFSHLLKEGLQVFQIDPLDDAVADLILSHLPFAPNVWTGAINDVPVLTASLETTNTIAVLKECVSVGAKDADILRSPDGSIFPEGQRKVRLEPHRGEVTASSLDTLRLIGIKAVADHIVWTAVVLKPILERLGLHAVGTERSSVAYLESPGLDHHIELIFGLPITGVAIGDFHAQIVSDLFLKSLDVLPLGNESDVMVQENNAVLSVLPHGFDSNQRGGMTARITDDVSRIWQVYSPYVSASGIRLNSSNVLIVLLLMS
jgi:hypothetical protein